MSFELWSGLGVVATTALLQFVINVLVKIGKLETRVDTAERDIDNLGEMVRNQKTNNRRNAA